MSSDRIIYDLCAGTGSWSAPYERRGYDVRRVDLRDGLDVRLAEYTDRAHGVLFAPPCDDFASSGARWWAGKGEAALLDALAVVDAGLRFIVVHRPQWWCLENPVGRLVRYLGPPRLYCQPFDFGDPYTKKTCLWGEFSAPEKCPVDPTEGGKIWRMPPSPDRPMLRSITPPGFAAAFCVANP